MVKISFLMVVLIIFGGFNNSHAQNEIKFHIPSYPPYTFEKQGKIQGIGVKLVDRIMKESGLQYSLQLVSNYDRAINDVAEGIADGFFLASQNTKRNEIAVLSKPVFINKWCWFYPADSILNPQDTKFKSEARVGTYVNSNQHKWLIANGYHVTGSPPQIDLLLKMLKADRINVILLPEAVFLDATHNLGENPENYKQVIQGKKPFGIYISKDYLLKNPRTMEKINAAINKLVNLEKK